MQRALFVTGAVALTVVVIASRRSSTANAEPAVTDDRRGPFFSLSDNRTLRAQLTSTQGELTLVKAQFERADKIIYYSTHYGINAGLAAKVFDASVREGVDPELAFRLVRLESEFNPRAVSKVGALGLTQLMPSTAKLYDASITRDKLFEPEVNLRVGFKYLRTLLDMYKGNVRYALLAYNRGEDAVWRDIRAGVNPGNGYDLSVLRGYKGKGTID